MRRSASGYASRYFGTLATSRRGRPEGQTVGKQWGAQSGELFDVFVRGLAHDLIIFCMIITVVVVS